MSSPDLNSDQRFVNYYLQESISESTLERFKGTMRIILWLRTSLEMSLSDLEVVDIGCGAGSQVFLWSQLGHRVHGIDVSAPLIEAANLRNKTLGLNASFHVGSAVKIPLPDSSFDVVLLSELLEHLPNWKDCLNEALRLLKPGGVVYLSTTNKLCPVQQEFDLIGYSWYPKRLKKFCENLAVTTHKHWVQYTSLPAVNWFSFYQLRDYLNLHGLSAFDRFDCMVSSSSLMKRVVSLVFKTIPLLKFVGHVLTPATVLVAYRRHK